MSERFHDSHWGHCLGFIRDLCSYSDKVLLVVGPNGIGKTAMKDELINIESSRFVISSIDAVENLNAELLTMQIEQDFASAFAKDCLLLIDDAQNLSLDVIAMLLQLKQKNIDGKLGVVLFATEDLERKVARSVLREDFTDSVQTIGIKPLAINEIEPFLNHLWNTCETDVEMQLTEAQCRKIYTQSGGIPAQVREIGLDLVNNNTKSGGFAQQSLSPLAVGVTVSFGFLFCILAMLWPAADKSKNNMEVSTQPLQVAHNEINYEEATITANNFNTLAQAEPTSEPIINASNNIVQPSLVASETLALNVKNQEPDNLYAKVNHLEKQIAKLELQVAKDQKDLRVTEQKLQSLLAKKPVTTTKKGQTNTVSKKLTLSKHEKKILDLPKANYTIQLLSMLKEKQVQDFIKNNKLGTKATYYKSRAKGKDWYVVIYGNYANKLDAQFALAELPGSIRKLKPLVRENMKVQQTISRSKYDRTKSK